MRKTFQMLPLKQSWRFKLDLLKTLVQRDLEARYKGSALGNFWAVINQLSQLIVYTYLFSFILRIKLTLTGLPENNFTFGLWLFAGLIPWTAFTIGVTQAASSVIQQANLVKKVVFPLSLIPLVPIFAAFLESSLGLILLISFVAFTGKILHPTLLLLPLIWIPQLLLTIGFGYLVASFTVFLRDIPQTLGVILNLVFYVTPIVYPISAVPEAFRPWILRLNPLAVIVDVYRDLILAGQINHGLEWAVMSGISCLLFMLGRYTYKRLQPSFADVL